MNIIVGKNGLIARSLNRGGEFRTTSSTPGEGDFSLDLMNPGAFDYSVVNAGTTVVMLAAVSSPDTCSNDFRHAFGVNVRGAIEFIERVLERHGKVLYFSSDVVYGNTPAPVDEDSRANPYGFYAMMKLMVEKYFENESAFKVFRLSYVLSSEDSFLRYIKSCALKEEEAVIYHPFSRKIIYIEDVIEAINTIVGNWDAHPQGVVNLCGEESVSRKDLSDYYNRYAEKQLVYRLEDPADDFWENRPRDINVGSKYLAGILGHKPTAIEHAIKEILSTGTS